MNVCHVEKVKSPVTLETRRKMSASMLKREPLSEETKAKMLKASLNKKFPPKCNKCSNRDLEMCARFNMKCFEARTDVCFRTYMKRNVHPEYIGTGVHRVRD